MKTTALRRQKSFRLPISWRAAEFAAQSVNAADTCDDRVSDDIFDVDDERAEVDSILHGMTRNAN